MKIANILKSLSGYPIPMQTIAYIAESNGLTIEDDIDLMEKPTVELVRAKADTYKWLADAPAVSQQGISYSFSDSERKHFRSMALDLLATIGEGNVSDFGYRGDLL